MQTRIKLSDIVGKLGLKIGDKLNGDTIITGVNTLEDAGPSELSFLANPKYVSFLEHTKAGAVILHPQHADKIANALLSENPYRDFARSLAFFAKKEGEFSGISPLASVHPDAKISECCTIYPFVFVGPRAKIGKNCTLFPNVYIGEDVELGEGCTLYPAVTIMARAKVGDNCIFHAGAVLGADGFGFVPGEKGIEKIPQIGSILLGSNIEIGANTAIDRAALGHTMIGNGTKIDNLVQIGHNVRVGEHCLLVSQVGIAGSARLGRGVTLAGQAGLSGHINLGDGVTVGPQAGVARDIEAGQAVGGTPAMSRSDFLRTSVIMPKLPELYTRLKKLERELEAIKSSMGEIAK